MKNFITLIFLALALTLPFKVSAGQIVNVTATGFRADAGQTDVMTLGKGIWEGVVSFNLAIPEVYCYTNLSYAAAYYGWLPCSAQSPIGELKDGLGHRWTLLSGTQVSFYSLVLPVTIKISPDLHQAIKYSIGNDDAYSEAYKNYYTKTFDAKKSRLGSSNVFNPVLSSIVYDITKVNEALMTNLDFYLSKDGQMKNWPSVIGADIPGVVLTFDAQSTHYDNYFHAGCRAITVSNSPSLTAAKPTLSYQIKAPFSFAWANLCETSRRPQPQDPEMDIRVQIPVIRVGYPAIDQL